jgi:hypothetical protein
MEVADVVAYAEHDMDWDLSGDASLSEEDSAFEERVIQALQNAVNRRFRRTVTQGGQQRDYLSTSPEDAAKRAADAFFAGLDKEGMTLKGALRVHVIEEEAQGFTGPFTIFEIWRGKSGTYTCSEVDHSDREKMYP